jgi:hypothetical protein
MYIQPKNAKKTVAFEIPVNIQNVEPAVSCPDTPDLTDIQIEHQPEPAGGFKMLQNKGLRITSYSETDGAGRPIT